VAGRLFAIVGPSGAGKDTLIAAVAVARPDLHIVRRVITRPTEAGGEPYLGVSPEDFAGRKAKGAFVLDWQAHGLSYGIPTSVTEVLATGRDAVFNGSRAMLRQATARFPTLQVILVTADPDVLAQRLAARGRETSEDITARLARAHYTVPTGLTVNEIANNGTIEAARDQVLACLQPERAAR